MSLFDPTHSIKIRFGTGVISTALAFLLSVSSFLGVLAFHFPAYLTTPELRDFYTEDFARNLLLLGLITSFVFAALAYVLTKRKTIPLLAVLITSVAIMLGGSAVPIGEISQTTLYLGIDFLILNLLLFCLIFISIEKLFGLRKQQLLFRKEWRTDLIYFAFNHVFIGIFLIIVNAFISSFHFAIYAPLQEFIVGLPFLLQLFLAVLVADMVQYWSHRAYHEIPTLWSIHAVHHSPKEMDWLAGSRIHILELLVTRSLILLPLFLFGFSEASVNAYILLVAFQGVFDHANISVNPGPLRYIFVTPNFHHWHHSQDKEALDKNYAAHFAFLDYLFGTAVTSQRMWPKHYGVLGDYIPLGFVKQFAFPFLATAATVRSFFEENHFLEKKPKEILENKK